VCVGGVETYWQLPACEPDDRAWIGGGERSMYELAFALAGLGHDVELRGRVSRPVYAELAQVTDRHPAVGAPSRRPLPGEIVLLLEGFVDPLVFASVALSEARPVIVLLAVPGLMGWSFEPGWSLPDPLAVDLASVNRPGSYQAMAAIGFELWTHSPGIAAAAEAAGVECRWIGSGSPGPSPQPVDKIHDVAVVGGNRWEPLARRVLEGLPVEWFATRPGSNAEMLRQLGSARVVVHPMRIEGTSRLSIEARLMGTVAVVLWHPAGAGFTRDQGVVAVNSIEALRQAVLDLLAQPEELQGLSRAGRSFAHEWRSWPAYRARVAAALASPPPPRPDSGARAAVGDAVDSVVATARDEQMLLKRRFAEIEAHARALERDREALYRYIEDDLLPQIRDLNAQREGVQGQQSGEETPL
jgi:hypothetical protein